MLADGTGARTARREPVPHRAAEIGFLTKTSGSRNSSVVTLPRHEEMTKATPTMDATSASDSNDIATTLFRLGATSYGVPAIMGFMQAELQERRKWVSKERFLEGLAVANMVPGATATQLGIFLAYARGGWWGGLLGGLAFVVPAFVIMLALTIAYATLGVTPLARSALYGLGPVVIGLFAIALYRLGKTAASSVSEAIIGLAAAAALATTRLGIVAILVLAGCAGLLLFYRGKYSRACAPCRDSSFL